MYDITKAQTFENLYKWLEELNEHADPNACIMIVGNKTDLVSLRAVQMEDGQKLAGINTGKLKIANSP